MFGLLLDDVSFWDVVWWMIIGFFLFMVIWMFIGVFADIFRRDDLNGWVKAAWVIALILLPWISIILYFASGRARPSPTGRCAVRAASRTWTRSPRLSNF